MSAGQDQEFFIGWQADPPKRIGRFLKALTFGVLLLGILLGVGISMMQETVTGGRFLFGKAQEFEGVLIAEPIPMLVVEDREEFTGQQIFMLSGEMKNGFDLELAKKHNLAMVKMKGNLLFDNYNAMIQVAEGSFEALSTGHPNKFPPRDPLGKKTLKGEIVDAKCYLGMMNPGVLKGHRACAIKCIAGGIPPMFLLRDGNGNTNKLIMTGPNGEAINQEVLNYVAEPLEVTGEVTRCGPLLFFAVDPENFKRLS